MITKNLMNALEEIGFNYYDNKSSDKIHAYAIYGGYLVSIYEISGKKFLYINFKFSDNDENSLKKYEISESFSAQIDEYSIIDYSITEDGLRVSSTCSTSQFLKLLDVCITLLVDNGIRGTEYCSKCGNKFGSRNPKKVTDGKENHLMCDHCALETVEEITNRITAGKIVNKENLGKGILGSVLFSIIGVALYFVLYYWLSPAISENGINEVRYIFCAVGFIVSLLAYVGFRTFSKNTSIGAYVTISVSSILFTTIGQYLGIVFEFIAKNNFSVSALSNKHFWLVHLRNTIPTDVAELFADYSGIFYKLLAISLMFAAVGAAIFLLTLHDKTNIEKENVAVETVVIKK